MNMYNIKDITEFVVVMIEMFARRYRLSLQEAESYLSRHGALELAQKHYGIMHTLRFEDNVESLASYCRRMGGSIA